MDEVSKSELAACYGKEKLASKGEARASLRRMKQRAKRMKRPDRTIRLVEYHCSYCGGWHLGRLG